MKMPSQEEQMIAEQYVLKRELKRPDTDIRKAVKYSCGFVVISTVLSVVIFYLFRWLGIFSLFSNTLGLFQSKHPILFFVVYYFIFIGFMGLISLKKAVIGAIKLYQHYAPEDIRRRCLFKPTCSEYAILAIKKYGLLIGLIKAYIRLFKKCRGNIYRVDYP